MKCIIFIVFFFSFCNQVYALQPPTRQQIEQYKRDGTFRARVEQAKSFKNHLVSEDLVARGRHKLQRLYLQTEEGMAPSETDQILAPPPAWQGMPTTGTVKVLALLIAFSDYPPVTSAATIESKLFGDGSGGFPYESLRNYYRRSSYNKLEIQGNILGWYITSYPRSNVPETTQGRQNLIKEALNYYDSLGHDFTQYDNDGNGTIDYLIVIWSGPHGAWASFWWGYMTTFSDSTYRLDGKRLWTYSWQWELYNYPNGSFDTKVVIHETGHALGLPDYYDYDSTVGPKGGVGGLDMMDGNWGDHNCFSKFLLDWINPPVHKSGLKQITLNPSGTSEDAIVVMPGALQGNQFFEFFMIQNRYRTGNDAPYPANGLLIWHVDARLNSSKTNFLYNNSYTDHKLLRLMEADGLEEIETGDGRADAGDYYVAGQIFGNDTSPNSKRYNGTATGIRVKDISAPDAQMSFSVFIPVRTVDFDMDGKADILSRSFDSGTVVIWFMDGKTISSVGVSGSVPLDWQIKGVGDFDGNGKSDILWQHSPTGTVAVWMTGSSNVFSVTVLGSVPSDWQIKEVGDFNGDGKSDLLWQHPASGAVAIWFMDGITIASVGLVGAFSTDWEIKTVGDFNGDGKSDLLWQHPSSGTIAICFMDGFSVSLVGIVGAFSTDWEFKRVGDFNGDGKSDLLWQHPASGTIAICFMDGFSVSSVGIVGAVSNDWQIKGVGDYNGDGKSDFLWQHPTSGTVAIWLMDGIYINFSGVIGALSDNL